MPAKLKNMTSAPEFTLRFLSKLPATNILHFEVVVEVEDETDAFSDVGRNAVKDIVRMRERLALGTGGKDGAILAEVVQPATLLDGRVIVEGNNDRRQLRTVLMARFVGVVLDKGVAVGGSAHVADLDGLERNGSPDNFFVEFKQGIEFVLGVQNSYSSTCRNVRSDVCYEHTNVEKGTPYILRSCGFLTFPMTATRSDSSMYFWMS